MTEDDEVMHSEILELRQEYQRNSQPPPPKKVPDALLRALELREEKGMSWDQIADTLNKEGLLTQRGKRWVRSNIYNHLTRRGMYAEKTDRSALLREATKNRPRDYHGRWTT
jgi:hypothetical protein